jgi:hypothetical protein
VRFCDLAIDFEGGWETGPLLFFAFFADAFALMRFGRCVGARLASGQNRLAKIFLDKVLFLSLGEFNLFALLLMKMHGRRVTKVQKVKFAQGAGVNI